MNDVLIIGGGASGMAAAIAAADAGDRVLLAEAGPRRGRKILASGNGRCNLMNLGAPAYHGDSAFALRVLEHCPPAEIRAFWESCGLRLRTGEEGRVYPYTLQASTVMETLENALLLRQVSLRTGCAVLSLRREEAGWAAVTGGGEVLRARRVIAATGGPAQPKLGGNESAAALLCPLGHTLIPWAPALSPLETDRRSVSGLAGIRVRCVLHLKNGGREVRREEGELLFTEDGISGICVMQCARFAVPGESVIEADLIPGLFPDDGSALAELRRRKRLYAPLPAQSLLQGICLPRLAFAVCKQAGWPLRGETCGDLQDEALSALLGALHAYRMKILSVRGFDRAQVSAGGLNCDEFSSATLESHLAPGVHAAGEALNVDGECGGFNLMFAWASGILAGRNGRK